MRSERNQHGRSARLAAVVTGLGRFLLCIGAMLTALYLVGTDDQLYYRLQMRADVLSTAGIDAEELAEIDHSLARYLGGDANALENSPFNADELSHMRDCYELFGILRAAMIAVSCVGIALTVIGSGPMRYRGRAAHRIGNACFWVMALAAVVWAMIDFDSLFEAFHRALFTNELWLMDPAKDLMIRICPESMFITMAALIVAITFVFTSIVGLAIRIAAGGERRQKYGRL